MFIYKPYLNVQNHHTSQRDDCCVAIADTTKVHLHSDNDKD